MPRLYEPSDHASCVLTEGQGISVIVQPENANHAQSVARYVPNLLSWYRANGRSLPWRDAPHDPYAVWVSEIMLQQTQVTTVLPYYARWMERFPTLSDLATAPEQDVLAAWSGLGYYSRARNLQKSAQMVVEQYGGQLPPEPAQLLKLPGIGRYTAGAISSICFNRPEPVVDGNVARVLSRVFALEADPKSSQGLNELWEIAHALVDRESPCDFNQAMMELGATLCSPTRPDCPSCPLNACCKAVATGDATQYPRMAPRPGVTKEVHASAVIERDGAYLLTQRPSTGVWANMWEFPRAECGAGESPECAAIRAATEIGLTVTPQSALPPIRHTVMNKSIGLVGMLVMVEPNELDGIAGSWFTPEEAARLPLPSPQRKLLKLVTALPNSGQRALDV
jgi:A/G-specific adenine glycosylase